jgi:hypothetical protein
MSVDLETRLWRQLEAAAERQARRGRAARALTAVRNRCPRSRTLLAVAATLAAVALVAAVARSLPGHTTPAVRPPARLPVLHISSSLDRGVVAGDRVYLHDTSADALLQVDPSVGRVAGTIPLHSGATDVSLAADSEAVWAVATPFLTHSAPDHIGRPLPLNRIDARTGRVTARIPLRSPDGQPFIPFGVIATTGRVWVWGPAGALRIDPDGGAIEDAISVPGDSILSFGTRGRDAWAVTALGRWLRFDAATGARVAAADAVPLDAPSDLAVASGALVLGDQHGAVLGIDPGSGRRLWHTRVASAVLAAATAGNRIWAAIHDPVASHDTLIALDPASGAIRRRIPLPAAGARSLVPVGDAIWVVMGNGDVVIAQP